MKRHKMVFKITKTEQPNAPLYDKSLSWKARGMLTYLLTLPEGTETSISELTNFAPDGRDSVRAGIDELIQVGYITPFELTSAKGRYTGIEYRVFDNAKKGWR